KEMAEEVRTNPSRNLDDASPNQLQPQPHLPLGHDWVPRFIQRHPHLKTAIGCRIESVRMDGAIKPVLTGWFDAYREIVSTQKIKTENIYNMDESEFSIGTMASTRVILDSTLRTKYRAPWPSRVGFNGRVCICADGTIL
ncbi:hypothetical protein LIPSTDRAFT_71820, partial [Lipomyces starkeyi NRRL Y-11557]